MTVEKDHEYFKEIRTRADSIANAIFLISGGALSISIGILLKPEVLMLLSKEQKILVTSSWKWLLASIVLFVLLKCHLVVQSFMLQWVTDFMDKNMVKSNTLGFAIGSCGIAAFVVGIVQLVLSAIGVVNA